MGKMPEEDKQKILQQVEFFRSEKLKFDREVAKWDDTGNDIIVLAKHMCMIMMEMTDFTRYALFSFFQFIRLGMFRTRKWFCLSKVLLIQFTQYSNNKSVFIVLI